MPSFTISPITPREASGPGALDGYGFDCSCRGGLSSSLEGLARQWQSEHIGWHLGRGDQVTLAEVRDSRSFYYVTVDGREVPVAKGIGADRITAEEAAARGVRIANARKAVAA